jgi:hypothetical protein
LLFEGEHAGQLFGCLDHKALHFVVGDAAVAWLIQQGEDLPA